MDHDPLISQPTPPTAAEFHSIAGLIHSQTKALDHLNDRLRLSEKRTVLMGMALILLLCVILFVGFLFFLVRNQTEQLVAQQKRTETIRSKSCDFYQLLLDYQTPQARETYPGGTAKYDSGIQSLRTIMHEIGCPKK